MDVHDTQQHSCSHSRCSSVTTFLVRALEPAEVAHVRHQRYRHIERLKAGYTKSPVRKSECMLYKEKNMRIAFDIRRIFTAPQKIKPNTKPRKLFSSFFSFWSILLSQSLSETWSMLRERGVEPHLFVQLLAICAGRNEKTSEKQDTHNTHVCSEKINSR